MIARNSILPSPRSCEDMKNFLRYFFCVLMSHAADVSFEMGAYAQNCLKREKCANQATNKCLFLFC